MISYAWRTAFAADEERELREMLAAAAAEDAEAGFPAVSLDQPYSGGASHLVVRLRPDDRAGQRGSSPPAPLRWPRTCGSSRARTAARPPRAMWFARSSGPAASPPCWWRCSARTRRRASPGTSRRCGSGPAATTLPRSAWRAGSRTWRRRPAASGSCSHPCGPRAGPAPCGWRAGPAAPAACRSGRTGRRDGAAGQRAGPRQPEVLVYGPGVAGAVWYDPHADEHTEYGTAGRIIAVRAAGAASPQIQARLLAAAMAGLHSRGLRWPRSRRRGRPGAGPDLPTARIQHDRTDIEYIVTGQASAEVSR